MKNSNSFGGRKSQWFLLVLLLALSCRAAVPVSKTASGAGCTVKPTTYLGWKAEQLSNRWVTLEVVPEIGGRLMQVTFGGHDFLYINSAQKGQVIALDSTVRGEHNYGGDKIWPMPEGNRDEQHWAQGGLQPLDFGSYKLEVISRGAKCTIRMTGPPSPAIGQRYIREISIGPDTPVISFHNLMQNTSGYPQTWSEQTITEYPTTDPDGTNPNQKLWSVTQLNPKSAYPNGYHVETGPNDNAAYTVADGNLRTHWNNIAQEVWIDTPAGWLAMVDGATGYTMVERHHIDPAAEYPGKSTIIFYSAGQSNRRRQTAASTPPPPSAGPFIEEEVNSPMVELAPGESYALDTTWYPTRMGEDFKTTTWAGVVGTQLTANRTADGLVLSGSFGVFYAGDLVAHFYPGADGTQKLMSVTPLEPVQLQTIVQAPANTSRVSVHLVDAKGVDRGPLGEVMVNPPPQRQGRTP